MSDSSKHHNGLLTNLWNKPKALQPHMNNFTCRS